MRQKKYLSCSSSLFFLFYVILTLMFVYKTSNAYNLSPKPNIVFNEPNFVGAKSKSRSSYFGYTINLKQTSILVSAPRAESSLKLQRYIHEIGVIYKCLFDQTTIGDCTPFNFDTQPNMRYNLKDVDYRKHNEYRYVYANEVKDNQWFGASMDGNEFDNDKFVVCAPRVNSNDVNTNRLNGLCYWTTNTSSSSPTNVRKIAPLRFKNKQYFNYGDPDYLFAMQGLSVHITENNEEILIGAPGMRGWGGSVIRYKPLQTQMDDDDDGIDYYGDIPNPSYWNQKYYSYFGYAVSSGDFEKNKLLYVASAPRADISTGIGSVFLFDIVDNGTKTQSNRKTIAGTNKLMPSTDKTIKIYHTLTGKQFGEYFGYSLLTEDFDNDGYKDVAVGAPFYGKNGRFDNGAVYIFRNKGTTSSFVLHSILQTDYELDGRFGTTMSKIGDINRDGYNDLLVSSPFEGNGAIYIFHGSANGLLIKPSQRIVAPENDSPANHMFGFGLSKGVDIDRNGYLDIAIGSPNSEKVYVFKSYPVIRTYSLITPFSNEIQITDESFKFNVCWKYESEFRINFDIHFSATIIVDDKHKRVSFDKVTNKYEIKNKTLTSAVQCIELAAFVRFSTADIFKPIEIEMEHSVFNDMMNHYVNDSNEVREFCENCVAVSPNSLTQVKGRIVFSTGCKNTRCIADLVLKSFSVNVSLPYILGSSSSLNIDFSVGNHGETAYLAQIRITLPDNGVTFTRIPSNCKLDEHAMNSNIMECDLISGAPIYQNDEILQRISIDTTNLDGKELVFKAQVYSYSDESNDSDNLIEKVILLEEFSNIEVFSDSSNKNIVFQNDINVDVVNLTHTFEIQNNGPSRIKSLNGLVTFPISYLTVPLTSERIQLINISSISVKNKNNNNQQFNADWVRNDIIATLNPMPASNIISTDEEKLLSKLPSNRTIYFNCSVADQGKCLNFVFSIENFTQKSPILITVNFTVDLKNLTKILTKELSFFVIRSSIDLINLAERDTSTIRIFKNHPFTIITKHFIKATPIWIYIVSTIIGILFMIVLSHGLYKLGFFKREKLEELNELKRQTLRMSMYQIEWEQ